MPKYYIGKVPIVILNTTPEVKGSWVIFTCNYPGCTKQFTHWSKNGTRKYLNVLCEAHDKK
jgi:hypothetical protein